MNWFINPTHFVGWFLFYSQHLGVFVGLLLTPSRLCEYHNWRGPLWDYATTWETLWPNYHWIGFRGNLKRKKWFWPDLTIFVSGDMGGSCCEPRHLRKWDAHQSSTTQNVSKFVWKRTWEGLDTNGVLIVWYLNILFYCRICHGHVLQCDHGKNLKKPSMMMEFPSYFQIILSWQNGHRMKGSKQLKPVTSGSTMT